MIKRVHIITTHTHSLFFFTMFSYLAPFYTFFSFYLFRLLFSFYYRAQADTTLSDLLVGCRCEFIVKQSVVEATRYFSNYHDVSTRLRASLGGSGWNSSLLFFNQLESREKFSDILSMLKLLSRSGSSKNSQLNRHRRYLGRELLVTFREMSLHRYQVQIGKSAKKG